MALGPFIRDDRYSTVAIAFHWTIALLVLFNLAVGLFHDGLPREWQLMPLHKAAGITVLVLSLGRLAWRLMHLPPTRATNVAPWEHRLALVVHWTLYFLMIAMPLTGWAMSSVGHDGNPPRPLTWFFLFHIPYLPVSPGMADFGHEAHEILGYDCAGAAPRRRGAAPSPRPARCDARAHATHSAAARGLTYKDTIQCLEGV